MGPKLPAEIEADVTRFGQYVLERQLASAREAPFWLRWVRIFLVRTTAGSAEEALERLLVQLGHEGRSPAQVAEAEKSVRCFRGRWREACSERPAAVGRLSAGAGGLVTDASAVAAVRELARLRDLAPRTEELYVGWIRRLFAYLDEVDRRPKRVRHAVTVAGIRGFLSDLATRRRVAVSTQGQAVSALLFLAREVLALELGDLIRATRVRRGQRLPSVLSVEEVAALLEQLKGTARLLAHLIYGGGLRVMEACRLRVRDVDFDQGLIFVRTGVGNEGRATLLARAAVPSLRAHLERVHELHAADLALGHGEVALPGAVAAAPSASREWAWQYVFPSRTLRLDQRTGQVRRSHVTDSAVQQAVKAAARKSGIERCAGVHTLRHSFAAHLLLSGANVRCVQELLGHSSLESTMIYTRVVRTLAGPAATALESPLDRLVAETRIRTPGDGISAGRWLRRGV